jgi:hypothetical protein
MQQSLGNISATKPLPLDYPESCPAPEVHPDTGCQSTFLQIYSSLWTTFLQLNICLQALQKVVQLQKSILAMVARQPSCKYTALGNIFATKPLSLDYPESCPAPEIHSGNGGQATFLQIYSSLWATFLQLNLGL